MLIIAITVITIIVVTVAKLTEKAPKPDQDLIRESCSKIKSTSRLDANHSLMESHKIMISSLQSLYPNTKLNAAQLLKKISKKSSNEKLLWKYHRMRNKAAHEVDYEISETDAKNARELFQELLQTL